MTMPPFARLLPLVLLALTACREQEVSDLCNTREEALSSSECQLTLGRPLERYISFGKDTGC